MGNIRKMGDTAVEDRSGALTLVAYDQANDQIVHISVNPDGRLNVILDSWGRTEYEYDGDDDWIYKGLHETVTADGSESDWVITKYTMDANKNITIKQKLTGIWNNRATLTWS